MAIVENKKNGRSLCVVAESAKYVQAACCGDYAKKGSSQSQYCMSCPSNNDGSDGLMSVFDCRPKAGYTSTNTPQKGTTSTFTGEVKFEPVAKTCGKDFHLDYSSKSCADLGFNNANKGKDKKVCSGSEINGECAGTAKTFAEAEAFCKSGGARLCSDEELKANEAKGSGCDLDKKRNCSRVRLASKFGFIGRVTRSGSRSSMQMMCYRETSAVHVRCCADVAPTCKKCPEHSTTPGAGAYSRTDCACKVVNGVQYNGPNGGKCEGPTKSPTPNPTRVPTRDRSVVGCGASYYLAGSMKTCAQLGLRLFSEPDAKKVQSRLNLPYEIPVLTNYEKKKTCGTICKADKDGFNCAKSKSACINNNNPMTFDDAKKHCEDRDMRLCSAFEIREAVPLGAFEDPDTGYNTFVDEISKTPTYAGESQDRGSCFGPRSLARGDEVGW